MSQLVLLLASLVSVQFASPLSLKIAKTFDRILPRTNYYISCKADEPVTQCQFNVNDKLYDLSLGKSTSPNNQFAYFGTGLDQGDCGILLKGTEHFRTNNIIGCRVRLKKQHWVYSEMTLIINGNRYVNVTQTPGREVTMFPGIPTNIMVEAGKPLTICRFMPTNSFGAQKKKVFNFDRDSTSANRNISWRYFGDGLQSGQCGVTLIPSSQDTYSGLWCYILTSQDQESIVFFRLIVAKPPEITELIINTSNFTEGAVLNATCRVRKSIPRASLQWFLGDQVITEGITKLVTKRWDWSSDTQGITEYFTKTLKKRDNNMILKCVSHYITIENNQSYKIKLTNPEEDLYVVIIGCVIGVSIVGAVCIVAALRYNKRCCFTAKSEDMCGPKKIPTDKLEDDENPYEVVRESLVDRFLSQPDATTIKQDDYDDADVYDKKLEHEYVSLF